ncbi:hypothetical protein Tco_1345325 [Tanacetum coccineum]
MSTQQDIYAAGSKNRPPMLNKDNYVPWSSRLLRYAKSKPNGKLIYNSIMNGPYVRRMIPEPGDPDHEVPVAETFHEQTDEELTVKEVKQMEADDQAIQIILMGLPEDIYAAVDSCETAHEIWLRVQQMMKGSDIGIQEKKAKLFNEWEMFTSTDGELIESNYHRFSMLMNDFKRNKHFLEKIASNLKFLNYLQPKWSRHEVNELRAERLARTHDPLALMANSNNPYNYPVFHQDQPSQITYMQQSPPNNNYNPQPSFNQNYMQQPMINPEDIYDPTTAMNMALVLIAKAFKLNYSTPTNNNQRISSNPHNRQIALPGMNMDQDKQMQMNPGVQNVGNQNEFIVVPGIANLNANQNGNGNVVAARAEGNEARIQIQAEEFDLMAAAGDLDDIEEVNANCILMANLQQASTSNTQTDKAPVYDSDGSAEVFSIWKAFGGNTRGLGSFGEETDKTTDLHQNLLKSMLTELGDGVTTIKRRRYDLRSDGVSTLVTPSERRRPKETLEEFVSREQEDHFTCARSELASLKAQAKRLFRNENVWVEMHSCVAWDKVNNQNPQNASPSEINEPYKPSPRMDSYEQPLCLGSTFVSEALRKSDQMHQTFEKSYLAMTHELDDMIELPKS